ncbi:MAG: hypothetical protein PVI26_03690 [Chitinispirillia bacterium]|jgi:hypothetical protein
MAKIRIDKIGLVAAYSAKGDWAFNLAYYLAKLYSFQLNIFSFSESPFGHSNSSDILESNVNCLDEKTYISAERKLREYYDSMLEDFENVGFKLCNSHKHNLELRKCLLKKDYQLLIIPYLENDIIFGNMPIEEFAYRFIAPVILVGPDEPHEYRINDQAKIIIDSLALPIASWKQIDKPIKLQESPII